MSVTSGSDRTPRRAIVAFGLALVVTGVGPIAATEVAHAVSPPKPRCKVVPGPKPVPPRAGSGNVAVTIPHVVCVPTPRPTTIGGQGGGNAQGGGSGSASGGGGGVPFTGFELAGLAGLALLALSGGSAALRAGRRRTADRD